MADNDRTILYAPDGRVVSVALPTVITRLKAQGYTETAPTTVAVPDEENGGAPVTYDPGEHTVKQVQAFLRDNPELTDQVLDAERAGRHRVELVGPAEKTADDEQPDDEPVEDEQPAD